jgi:hypothetical protein
MAGHWKASAVILFVLLSAAACTRQASTSAAIRLDLGAFLNRAKTLNPGANNCVGDIIINISAPDISPPIFYHWSGNRNCAAPPDPLDPITVPSGEGRLVQALVIFSGSGREWLYGDNQSNLAAFLGGEASVYLNVGSIGVVGNDEIQGRYLGADGLNGPTGHVSVFFNPSSAPKMLIDTGIDIINGWFRAFAIEGSYALDYVVSAGSPYALDLFGGPVASTSAGLVGAGSMSVYLPVYDSCIKNAAGACSYFQQPSGTSAYGFFGPGVGASQICFNNATEPILDAYDTSSQTSSISWVPSSGTSSDAHPVSGGSGVNTIPGQVCALSGTSFVDYLSLNDQQVTSQGQALGFWGPFVLQPGGPNGGFLILSPSLTGNTYSVTWTFLPGVESTSSLRAVDGVDLFMRIESGKNLDFLDSNGRVNCSQLPSQGFRKIGGKTFVSMAGVTTSPQTETPESIAGITLASDQVTAFNSGLTTTILCPYSGGAGAPNYFTSAAVDYPRAFP